MARSGISKTSDNINFFFIKFIKEELDKIDER